MANLRKIGTISRKFANVIGNNYIGLSVFQSDGLRKHISKRHPECIKYIGTIPSIVSDPDYIGINPNENGVSFELVKNISDNVQLGIKLDSSGNFFYVATLYTITNAKLQRNIQNGRLHTLRN